mmetsp:Transcript_7421/g.29843  ORF Transcript_7421/g.29843 Transcript_7421/m.29843 type:complete len:82 (+) Transcript_7421:135-380(+)
MPTQCVSTAVIGTAFCVKRCSSERLARDLAFFPPEPPSYALGEREASDDGDGERERERRRNRRGDDRPNDGEAARDGAERG